MTNLSKVLIPAIVILSLLTTIAYSSLTTTLEVKGEANVRAPSSVRVVDIKLKEVVDATELYSPKYTKNTISTGFILNNNNSKITYEITIRNNTTTKMMISNILESLDNNGNIIYELTNYNLYDELPSNNETKILITYKGQGKKESTLEFNFTDYYHTIAYNAMNGKYNDESNINYVKYHFNGKENIIVDGTVYTPSNNNLLFSGWYTNESLITPFNSNNPVLSNQEVYAKYIDIDFNITNDKTDCYKLDNKSLEKDYLVLNKTNNTIKNLIINFDYSTTNNEILIIKIGDISKEITLDSNNTINNIIFSDINLLPNATTSINITKKNTNNSDLKITNFYLLNE